jgi:uncharacterized protein (TIGR03118 family)
MIREGSTAVNRKMRKVVISLTFMLVLTLPASAQYKQTNLVSDIANIATLVDSKLVNPWGMSHSPASPFWISDAGAKFATLYAVDGTTGTVAKVPLEVAIPAPPSGQVFNSSPGFVVSQGGGSGPAVFIFAGLDGTISGWNPGVPPPTPPATISKVATLAATGTPPPAAYTGLGLGTRGSDLFLYAANNAAGRIDVFDKTFTQVSVPGPFTDPSLPAGSQPFNVVNIGGSLYVTYSGPTGVVNVFDTDGNFVKRFATGGTLLNPWGIAVAPAGFGKFSNALLIGSFNFGDRANGPGSISAFDPATGNFLGLLEDTSGAAISIDGLWSLVFGNGHSGGISNVLYFTAGVENQMHGLFGSLAACHGPVITGASASPNVLWPPNHQLVSVTVNYAVSDDCDPAPSSSLAVSSNEGEGGGSGNTFPDWMVLDAHDVDLVAERMGTGNGRVYTITINCTDKAGLTSSTTVTVTVPHDLGSN